MAQGDFAAAQDRVDSAPRVVNEYQFYLGEDLYKQYTQRLNQTAERIREAQAEREKQLAEQKRTEAAAGAATAPDPGGEGSPAKHQRS